MNTTSKNAKAIYIAEVQNTDDRISRRYCACLGKTRAQEYVIAQAAQLRFDPDPYEDNTQTEKKFAKLQEKLTAAKSRPTRLKLAFALFEGNGGMASIYEARDGRELWMS